MKCRLPFIENHIGAMRYKVLSNWHLRRRAHGVSARRRPNCLKKSGAAGFADAAEVSRCDAEVGGDVTELETLEYLRISGY